MAGVMQGIPLAVRRWRKLARMRHCLAATPAAPATIAFGGCPRLEFGLGFGLGRVIPICICLGRL